MHIFELRLNLFNLFLHVLGADELVALHLLSVLGFDVLLELLLLTVHLLPHIELSLIQLFAPPLYGQPLVVELPVLLLHHRPLMLQLALKSSCPLFARFECLPVALLLDCHRNLVLSLFCLFLKLAIQIANLLLVELDLSFKLCCLVSILPLFFLIVYAFTVVGLELLILLSNPVVVGGHSLCSGLGTA